MAQCRTHILIKSENPIIKAENGNNGDSDEQFVNYKIVPTTVSPKSDANKKMVAELMAIDKENERLFFDLQKQIKQTIEVRNELSQETLKNVQQQEELSKCGKENVLLKSRITVLEKEIEVLRSDIGASCAVQCGPASELLGSKPSNAQANALKLSTPNEKPTRKRYRAVEQTGYATKKKPNQFEVDSILRDKTTKGQRKFLVHWKGYSSDEDRWVDEKQLLCPKILAKYMNSKSKH